MNSNIKPSLGKIKPSIKEKPQYNPHSHTRSKAPNGKATEREVTQLVQNYYGAKCRIDRLPDSLDAGHYEDRRPCDLFVTIARGVASPENTIWYLECKETGQQRKTLQFSVLNDGQNKAINSTIALEIPYFVVFQHLPSKTLWLVPATAIRQQQSKGKKSMNEQELEAYLWVNKGKLYDNFKE